MGVAGLLGVTRLEDDAHAAVEATAVEAKRTSLEGAAVGGGTGGKAYHQRGLNPVPILSVGDESAMDRPSQAPEKRCARKRLPLTDRRVSGGFLYGLQPRSTELRSARAPQESIHF